MQTTVLVARQRRLSLGSGAGTGLKLPKKMQADFSKHVQTMADNFGCELNTGDIWDAFQSAANSSVAC